MVLVTLCVACFPNPQSKSEAYHIINPWSARKDTKLKFAASSVTTKHNLGFFLFILSTETGQIISMWSNSRGSHDSSFHSSLCPPEEQKNLLQTHNDDQEECFEEEKRRISIVKGKEHVDSTFTLSTANTPPQSTGNTPTDSDDDTPTDGVFSTNSFDAEEGGVADYNNLDPTIDVPSTPTLRIHKIHPQSQIIGKKIGTNHQRISKHAVCLFLTQEEPKKVSQALANKWVEACKKNCYHSKLQSCPDIEAIRLFLSICNLSWALLSIQWMSKVHFCMATITEEHDIWRAIDKTLFIRRIEEFHVGYSSMGELTFFLGLQVKQSNGGIFLSQDKYVKDILNKFDFRTIKPASTPIEAHKSLGKDEEGEDVDVHLYRSMIGCLMYLTASRPEHNVLRFCLLCKSFKVTPKVSHLHAVKRIFRYLKHQPNLGLWYPKDSPFHLEAFSDSDYAGDNHDRRSTSGGCQYLGRRLVSWQCKKQTIVAISSTEAEYVAAASCCAQVLWMQNQLLDYGFNFMNTEIHIDNESTICIVKNPVFHSKTKHIQIRHHFIRDCYEQRLINVVKVHTDDNVADLLTKGFDLARFKFLVVTIGMMNP
ncbi:putative ribonuclease H-like domain-containing protein [Tanacetum coccineum]|uniref:Ribonuclease H-like domain-containing protein n=1 Tax=Tanacetum coccineum TaxID=301880 RepID=A0ABQ5HAX4_9ASTR